MFVHHHLPAISFPMMKGIVGFSLYEFHLFLHFRIMFFGWEFGNSTPAVLSLKAITSPNFSRRELASRPLKETSQLPGGPWPGLSALLREACSWRGLLSRAWGWAHAHILMTGWSQVPLLIGKAIRVLGAF